MRFTRVLTIAVRERRGFSKGLLRHSKYGFSDAGSETPLLHGVARARVVHRRADERRKKRKILRITLMVEISRPSIGWSEC